MIIGGLPAGLLSLLDAQNFGQSPNTLVEVVSPTVDLTPMYALSKQQSLPASVTAAGVGFAPFTANFGRIVPEGEAWWVKHLSFIAQSGAAEAFRGTLAVRLNGIATPLLPEVVAGANESPGIGGPCDFWAPAGSEFGVWTSSITGSIICSMQIIASRFRV